MPVGPKTAALRDRLQAQPTYEVTGMPNSLGHNESYENVHRVGCTPNLFQQAAYRGSDQHSPRSPLGYRNQYFDQPYESDSSDQAYSGTSQSLLEAGHQYWQDDMDERPMLQSGNLYDADPCNIESVDQPRSDLEAGSLGPSPPASNAAIRRWKTVKEVQLFDGNLVLDCPVPLKLLSQIQHAQPPERD
jgi:chitin synthase